MGRYPDRAQNLNLKERGGHFMKNRLAASYHALLALLLVAASAIAADEKFTAKSFAGVNGRLNEQQAALYIAYRDKEPLSKFLKPGETTLDSKKLVTAMADKLDDLRSKTHHRAPWTWQELDAAFPAKKTPAEEAAALPAWKKIEGLTKEKKLGQDGSAGSLGPLRLRKSAADVTQTAADPKKTLKDVKGATFGFSDNFLLDGNGAWNSEGVLDYPIKFYRQGNRPGQSFELQVGPATEWKLAETQEKNNKDVQELNFSFPLTLFVSPGREKMKGTYEENMAAAGNTIFSQLWVIQSKPYFQTDFSFQHEIYGAEASAEFVGGLFGGLLYLGGFHNMGASGLQYQLRAIPKLDYSATERGGTYTTRKPGDDWFRVGGLLSLDFRLGGKSFNPLDVGVSYQFMDTLSGSGDFADLIKAHATWWLSENAGLTLEYSKGDTPVAMKQIDLVTLGLEFKY
jgi:hypothetical protein